MKTVLAIMIVASAAMGQDTLSNIGILNIGRLSYHFAAHQKDISVLVEQDTVFTENVYAAPAIWQMIHDWREYKTWCAETVMVSTGMSHIVYFSDSVKNQARSIKKFYVIGTIVPDSILAPRNSFPMFNDFVLWLERKYLRKD